MLFFVMGAVPVHSHNISYIGAHCNNQLENVAENCYDNKKRTQTGLFAEKVLNLEVYMNFYEIAQQRQSCRSYDAARAVEEEKLQAILESVRLAPSACNGQPYHISVCRGETAKAVAKATQGMGMNKFAADAPLLLVISEKPYVKSAALGAKVKGNDYRSIDIGIAAAYITAEACAQGLGSCILGWLDDAKIREICHLDGAVRLVITIGYAKADDKLRTKKRKPLEELVNQLD